jgi:hypothetical protein
MSRDKILEFLTLFRTDNIIQQLHAWNIGDLSHNPLFLGGFAVIILFTYVLGWRKISAFMIGLGGFTLILSLAIGKGTGIEGIAGGGLLMVVVGGGGVISLFIYLLFVKSE